ncbi:MAG: metal-dependent transcriptional regulator [archaeon]|nr:metal-dependent transcriptional regulator [archaeon]
MIDKKDTEDYLRHMWVKEFENKETLTEKDLDNEYIAELFKKGYVNVNDGIINLSNAGEHLGRSLVRKHRIAEKVMADLFLADMDEMEELADQIEHIMSDEVEDNICRILGHPENCPHNNPIPEGNCCDVFDKENSVALINCENGFAGEVSYIKTDDGKKLQKIMNLGLIPGSKIILIQKFPNYVFQLGNTQLAVDKELANEIFVKKED